MTPPRSPVVLMAAFRGTHTLNLDAKGRLALPSRVRAQVMEACGGHLVLTIDSRNDGHLLLYPTPDFEEVVARIDAMPGSDAVRAVQRLFVGHAQDIELDGNGRFLITPELRNYATLDKKVALVGQGRRLEVWSDELWGSRRSGWLEEASASASGVAATLDELSI